MKLADVAPKIPGSYQKSQQFVNEYKLGRGCKVEEDGTINNDSGPVDLIYFQGSALSVQFGRVRGNFVANDIPITSMRGFPERVGGNLLIDNTLISSLDGIPTYIGDSFYCRNTKLRSLTGIDKRVRHIGGAAILSSDLTHLLGLLAIPGLKQIFITGVDQDHSLVKILNKYIGSGDILAAQDELIDAGFKEQARP